MTVVQVVERILERMGRPDLEPASLNQASLEIREQYLDCAKTRKRLGWRPRFTFEEGIDRTVRWYEEHLSRPAGV